MALSRRSVLQMAFMPALFPRPQVQDLAPTTSRVYPGIDNKLVYIADDQGNTIIDSSHAGYGGGGVGIPTVPVRETIWPVAGDNTENIQAAINKVAARPLDPGGVRGAVLLKAGYYRMATPVKIEASGVVLRGEGMGDTGTILIGTGTGRTAGGAPGAGGGNQGTLIMIGGASGVTTKDETKQIITDDYVPAGARRFKVASARSFRPGDTVVVRRIGNQDWIDAVGLSAAEPAGRSQRAASRESGLKTCVACRNSIRPSVRRNTATWIVRTTLPKSITTTKTIIE